MTLLKQAGLGLTMFFISVAAVSGPVSAAETDPSVMEVLENVEELKAQFNADTGKPRLLLLLSPT